MGHSIWMPSEMTIKFSSSHEYSYDVHNLTDGCAIQPRADSNGQFSLNSSNGISWDGKYYRKSGTDERSQMATQSNPDRKRTSVFCCSQCNFLSYYKLLIWGRFITASVTLFYRLVEVNTETLAEPMPRAYHQRFSDSVLLFLNYVHSEHRHNTNPL